MCAIYFWKRCIFMSIALESFLIISKRQRLSDKQLNKKISLLNFRNINRKLNLFLFDSFKNKCLQIFKNLRNLTMSVVWNKICQIFSSLVQPTRRKTRVTFSPSTLHREIVRNTKLKASTNPFFNFLAEVRMKAMDNDSEHLRTLRDNAKLSQTAGNLWSSMAEEQKEPYRKIAVEQRRLKRLRGGRPRVNRKSWDSNPFKERSKRRSKTKKRALMVRESTSRNELSVTGGGDGSTNSCTSLNTEK